MKVMFLLCFVLVATGFVSAEFGYNNLDGPILTPETAQNVTNIYNNITTNGSAIALDDLSDVNASSPADGESLVWSSAFSRWISETVISRWIVSTANGFLYNDSNTLYFNDTLLNDTIDARAGSIENDFELFINASAYNNVIHNITAGDANDIDFTIEPGKKFIFGEVLT